MIRGKKQGQGKRFFFSLINYSALIYFVSLFIISSFVFFGGNFMVYIFLFWWLTIFFIL